ncbi:hypothetical protein FDP41_009371 [Naegleria fowleri]|uniref:C2HC/C3H-type domain-containing protein n=1 Tax=Naegleria fowleri TaxID=5763 RepID=A0A6A5BEX3_NAEFO|nr:uncharacterized protein FDP41_009371 [Naegleria fowleri]KAF0972468.1 hypothetical protein FDP41_009371 [Naegleria fowleri]CAG4718226.1 unnamed protein product [Naegleria fowleri]
MTLLVCHYCGGLIAQESLQAHLVQCSSEWHTRQKQLIPELQRAYPPRDVPNMLYPSSESDKKAIEKYNSFAKALYLQDSLNPCPSCLHLFPAQELGAHFISCNNTPQKETPMIKPQRSVSPEKPKYSPDRSKEKFEALSSQHSGKNVARSHQPSTNVHSSQIDQFLPTRETNVPASVDKRKVPTRDLNGKPIAYCCHLCGGEYLNVGSLTFHIPKCLEKRITSQKELPKEYRTKAPHAPTVPIPEDRLAEDFLYRLEEYNQQAYRIYEQSSRVQCKYCGRKFNPESLMVHVRACEKAQEKQNNVTPFTSPMSTGSSINMNNTPVGGHKPNGSLASGNYVEIERAECSKCGRKFALDRLPIHESSCKGIGLKKENNPPASKILTERAKNFGIEHDKPKTTSESVSLSTPPSFSTAMFRQSLHADDDRVACPNCNRKFNPDRIEKHVSVCKARVY